MVCGNSETILSGLKEILQEIETVCGGTETSMSQSILVSIKNTMSDRHIVQKKFNLMLQEYRCEILPDVIEGWENLAEADQERIKKKLLLWFALCCWSSRPDWGGTKSFW